MTLSLDAHRRSVSYGYTVVVESAFKFQPEPANKLSSLICIVHAKAEKLEVVGYVEAHTDAKAARHFSIPRTTLHAWKGLELQPKDRRKSQNNKEKHV